MLHSAGPRRAASIALIALAAALSAGAAEVSFRSVLEGYQPFSDEPVGSWREANDTVGRIGGWRAYAKEASSAASAARPAASAPPRSGPPGGHGRH